MNLNTQELNELQKNINKCLNEYSKKINTFTSFKYLTRDIIFCLLVLIITNKIKNYFNYYFLFTIYSISMGTVLTSLWVLGHECGHGAFSKNKKVNNIVGFIIHSFLLVPYFSWQYTHQKHHKYTNHLVLGETHVPPTKDEYYFMLKLKKIIGEDAFIFFNIFIHLIIGWPAYLLFNVTGGKTKYDLKTRLDLISFKDHFFSISHVMKDKYWPEISTIGCLTTVYFLINYLKYEAIFWYFGPYLIVNMWLVSYTLLQHTDVYIPHYGSLDFTFLKGALSTVDRPYPYLIDCLHHHIGTTHVVHHLNYKIPHYEAKEATLKIKNILKDNYNFDNTNIFLALFNINKKCLYVEDDKGIQFYKS